MKFLLPNRTYQSTDRKVLAQAKRLAVFNDDELRDSALQIMQRCRQHPEMLKKRQTQIDILSHGVEAVRRSFGFYLHSVQVRAVVAAVDGNTIEMQTGEGKTVVSAMIGYYYAHLGHVHLATTNQYLAERDYEIIRPIYTLLGVSSGMISQNQPADQKQSAYWSDITFGPGYQFGFDYLLDQTTLRQHDGDRLGVTTLSRLRQNSFQDRMLQQGGYHTMIIDEADSVMIDEALTPLVLSGAGSSAHDPRPYRLAELTVQALIEDDDYRIDARKKRVQLTEPGVRKSLQHTARLKKMQLIRPWISYLENALHARHFLKRNENYVVDQGSVKIVDQFTGRIFDDRQWQSGLHQAVCAKEAVEIDAPSEVMARVSRQRYFLLYQRLIGLSGTIRSVGGELKQTYRTNVALIPTHKPTQRRCLKTRFFATDQSQLNAVVQDVIDRYQLGQPVLLGTRTITQSLTCADRLQAAGLEPALLNGVQDQEEAEIVAQAGIAGRVTIATNMAGRGTDIKLDVEAKKNGGLHVVGFGHNFSRRVDRQLIGRCARQGQPGSCQFFQSCEDELLMDFPSDTRRLISTANNIGECSASRGAKLIAKIQSHQEKKAAQTRKSLMDMDRWLKQVRETLVKETA